MYLKSKILTGVSDELDQAWRAIIAASWRGGYTSGFDDILLGGSRQRQGGTECCPDRSVRAAKAILISTAVRMLLVFGLVEGFESCRACVRRVHGCGRTALSVREISRTAVLRRSHNVRTHDEQKENGCNVM
jgi:hypothetical protein